MRNTLLKHVILFTGMRRKDELQPAEKIVSSTRVSRKE